MCAFSSCISYLLLIGMSLLYFWLEMLAMVWFMAVSSLSATLDLARAMLWQWCALFWKYMKSQDCFVDIVWSCLKVIKCDLFVIFISQRQQGSQHSNYDQLSKLNKFIIQDGRNSSLQWLQPTKKADVHPQPQAQSQKPSANRLAGFSPTRTDISHLADEAEAEFGGRQNRRAAQRLRRSIPQHALGPQRQPHQKGTASRQRGKAKPNLQLEQPGNEPGERVSSEAAKDCPIVIHQKEEHSFLDHWRQVKRIPVNATAGAPKKVRKMMICILMFEIKHCIAICILQFYFIWMRGWRKQLTANQPTLDRFLKPKEVDEKETIKRASNKIKVPPSSGLPPLAASRNAVLRYPIKPEFREYQQEIVSTCICNNTLVCLPTGVGKTHIAAVIIANFSRWFPEQKIVFLAPTRPLVRQQVSTLKHLGDQVQKEKILEVNGQLASKKREKLYEKHQVIFATPQTIQNDLKAKRLDGKQIVLLVFDECHRAVGGYSYTKIIELMNVLEVGFRVVGLSATPGSEIEKIQEVISNLNIKKIVYKDENDKDVKKYLHDKAIKDVVIAESSIIRDSLAILDKFAMPSINNLVRMRLAEPWMVRNGLASVSFFLLREKFNENIKGITSKEHKATAYAACSIVNFLVRCRKALNEQGYQTFKTTFFAEIESQNILKNRKNVEKKKAQQEYFSKVYETQESQYSLQGIYDYYPENSRASVDNSMSSSLPKVFIQKVQESDDYKKLREMFYQGTNNQMHPKLMKTAEILQAFFAKNQGKAIVFTQHRLSAKQIKEYLTGIESIKSELFMGQAKTLVREDEDTGESCFLQLKQKEQLEVIDKYKRGDINTLISTSIGEEGLDIGEVDCIVCYDGGHSPIRAIQRRGRTGRKRAGEVYIMLMEGKEHNDYKKGLKRQQKMKDILRNETQKFQYFAFNSSLFEDNSIIPIQYYENSLHEENSNSKQYRPEEQDGKKTKKNKRNSKKDKQDTKQQQQQQPEQLVQIKLTTISSLLEKYKDSEQEASWKDEDTFDAKVQAKHEESEKLEESSFDQSELTEQICSQSIVQAQQVQSDRQQSPKQSIYFGFDFDDLQTAQQEKQQSIIKQIIQEDESDSEDILAEYYLNKKQEQAAALNNSNDSQDSLQSEQLLDIVLNYQKKRELLDIDNDNII